MLPAAVSTRLGDLHYLLVLHNFPDPLLRVFLPLLHAVLKEPKDPTTLAAVIGSGPGRWTWSKSDACLMLLLPIAQGHAARKRNGFKWQPLYSPWRLCGWNCSHLGAGNGPNHLGPSLHPAGSLTLAIGAVWLLKTLLGLWTGGNIWCLHVAWTFQGMSVGFQENIPSRQVSINSNLSSLCLPHTCKNPISQNMSHVQAQSHWGVAPHSRVSTRKPGSLGVTDLPINFLLYWCWLELLSLIAKIFITDRESKDLNPSLFLTTCSQKVNWPEIQFFILKIEIISSSEYHYKK